MSALSNKQPKYLYKQPVAEWNKTAEENAFSVRHICKSTSDGVPRIDNSQCSSTLALVRDKQILSKLHGSTHFEWFDYSKHPNIRDICGHILDKNFVLSNVFLSPGHVCFLLCDTIGNLNTGLVMSAHSGQCTGYFQLHATADSDNQCKTMHIKGGSVSRDQQYLSLVVREHSSTVRHSLHIFQVNAYNGCQREYVQIRIIKDLPCEENNTMRTCLLSPIPGTRHVQYAIAPVLSQGKYSVVISDIYDRYYKLRSRDLKEYVGVDDVASYRVDNITTSMDNMLLFVCTQALYNVTDQYEHPEKRGRILIFCISKSDDCSLDIVCSLSTNLYTYWWQVEFECFANVTPEFSRCGQHMALYTRTHITPEETETSSCVLVYKMPITDLSLKAACRRIILRHMKLDYLDKLPIPQTIQTYLKFES